MRAVKYWYKPEDDSDIYIEWKGGGWAIMRNEFCLNKEGDWEYEPMPSSRTEDFFIRCRFDNSDQAKDHIDIYYKPPKAGKQG